jgi:outer membrane biosynthesis protein TonB
MHEAVSDILTRRREDPGGLNRAMSISIAIHVTVVVLLFVVPHDWLSREREKPLLMTISLGGSLGDRSGGMVAAGARPVEQVAPQPERPKPIPPAVKPKPDALTVPTKPVTKPTPKPEPTTGAISTRTPTPITGAQVQRGNSVAETKSTSQSTGITYGGGAGGATATIDSDFCCKEYLEEVLRRINVNWDKLQPETGSTTVVFEINKDGTFTMPVIEKSSGSVALDLASKRPFTALRLQPLPKEYPSDRLKIHLTFPYVR